MGLTKVSYAMINGAVANVLDYGAVGDGVADDTVAIQNAIDAVGATGGCIYFPEGGYLISSPLDISFDNIGIKGTSWKSSKLIGSASGFNLIDITGDNCSIEYMYFTYNGTMPATAASTALNVSANNFSFSQSYIHNVGTGIYLTGGAGAWLSDFYIEQFGYAGIDVQSYPDAFICNFALQASVTTGAGSRACLNIVASPILVHQADILSGNKSINLESSAYCYFTNLYCDSSVANPLYVLNSHHNKFTNCWFSGGRSGSGFTGANIFASNYTDFVNCTFINNGGYGAFVNSGVNTSFIGCTVDGNSVTAGNNVTNGIGFNPNVNNFIIEGCTIGNSGLFGQQGYGISIAAGTSNNFIISNNNLLSNGTSAILDQSTGSTKYVSGNVGYRTSNSGTATITSGTSVTVTHGLSVTPTSADISVTPTSSIGANSLWVSNITSTTFNINTSGSLTATFAWQARTAGA